MEHEGQVLRIISFVFANNRILIAYYVFLNNNLLLLGIIINMKIIAAILINLLATTLAQTSTQICSSSCVSWVSACKNFNYNGCIVCDPSLYL